MTELNDFTKNSPWIPSDFLKGRIINLETRPLKEVPVGGCFIHRGVVGFYIAVRHSVGEKMSASDLVYSTAEGTPILSTMMVLDNDKEVAYTGVMLNWRV